MNLAISIERKRNIKSRKIIDMLEQLDIMVNNACENLNLYDSLTNDAPLRMFNTKHELRQKLNTYKAMQERLWNYYAVTLER